jgi:hypothetical protein
MDNFDLKKYLKENKLFEKIQDLKAGEHNPELIPFLEAHLDEVKEFLKINYKVSTPQEIEYDPEYAEEMLEAINSIEGFDYDGMGDATPYPSELGISFRYADDIDNKSVGQEGDKPGFTEIGGRKIAYVGYNI